MKLLTRTMVAVGAVSMAAASTARADAPDLSGFANATVFTAGTTGVVNATYLFARAEYTNNLVLFVAVGGAGITYITVPGNYPNVGVGAPHTVAIPVIAGQTLLFGICSSGGTGSANALACPPTYGAYYMGPGANNNDGSIHAAILTDTQWNTAATGSGCLGEVPACFLAAAGTMVVGFEDTPIPGGDADRNDLVFSFDNISTVPEPGTMGLLAVGLVGLSSAGLIRRRSAKRND